MPDLPRVPRHGGAGGGHGGFHEIDPRREPLCFLSRRRRRDPPPGKTGAGLLRQVPPPGNPDLPAIRPRARRRPGQGGSGLLQRLPRPQPHAVELPEPRLARQPKKNSRHLRRLPRQGRRTGQRALDRTQTRRFLRPHRSRDRVRGGKGQRGRLLRLPRHARSPRVRQPGQPGQPARIAATCGGCHQNVLAVYKESIHGNASAHGIKESPVCTDCHGEHTIRSASDPASMVYRGAVTKTCSGCHESERLVAKFGLPSGRLKSFMDTYHGLASKRGDMRVANCGSCHGWHDVLPHTDTRSAIHPTNLSNTCGAATREPKPSSCRDAFTPAPTTVRICGS
jgi:hypothetical protein